MLLIDETGDRKDGAKTTHVGRHSLGHRGTTEHGGVAVGRLWADAGVSSPLPVAPSTPASWFAQGKTDPAFRTKPQIALALVDQVVAGDWSFRAVVAECLYGEHHGFTAGVRQRNAPYVLALKPSHA